MLSLALVLQSATGLVVPSVAPATRAVAPARTEDVSMLGPARADKYVWVSFARTSDIKPGRVISGFQYGQEIAIAAKKNGELYALSNKLPPTGQPATLGNIFGDVIVEPLTNTAFSLKTGKVKGPWCPSPLGKLIIGRLIKPQEVPVFKVRKQGSAVQVLINVNAKQQFEASYWRGILDAQGKVDGGYY